MVTWYGENACGKDVYSEDIYRNYPALIKIVLEKHSALSRSSGAAGTW